MMLNRIFFCALMLCLASVASSRAQENQAEVKTDFRGLKPGMNIQDANKIASDHDGTCPRYTNPAVTQVPCNFDAGKTKVFLYLTPKGRVWILDVIFFGNFNEEEMKNQMIKEYGLSPGPQIEGPYVNPLGFTVELSDIEGQSYRMRMYDSQALKEDTAVPYAKVPKL